MGGGDLLNLLIERDVFEEDFTRFYVAEVRVIVILIMLVRADLAILVAYRLDGTWFRNAADGPCY